MSCRVAPRIATCTAACPKQAVALVACAFELPQPGADRRITIQLTPDGAFRPRDGRDTGVDAWHMDADIARRVIERFRQRATQPVLDYEHQTLNAEDNGRPAPAAGWITGMQYGDGGLFATVQLTERAAQYIRDGEYRHISPVFTYDPDTGEVLSIEMAALTNYPALDGMQPLELRAAARFLSPSSEDFSMNELMKLIAGALGLSEQATEKDAVAALKAHFDKQAEDGAALRKALAADPDADTEALVARCGTLVRKATAVAGQSPDPEKYVAVATFETVKRELAALKKQVQAGEVDALVQQGLDEGRLLPAQEAWASELGASNIAALRKYLEATAPITALTGTQTGGKAPKDTSHADDGAPKLTETELAVCKATGIDPKDYAAAKADESTTEEVA